MNRSSGFFRAVSATVLFWGQAGILFAEDGDANHHALRIESDFCGWTVIDCDARVEDDVLVLKGNKGFVRTADRQEDFVLEFDWRARDAAEYDGGVFIRAPLPEKGQPWSRDQIDFKKGEGSDPSGLATAIFQRAIRQDQDAWNHIKLTVTGDSALLEINGTRIWSTSTLKHRDGYVGFEARLEDGGQFEFRNVKFTELEYRPLFNGHDLAGWQGATDGYKAEHGVLAVRDGTGGNLYTKDEFSDFSLRFDFKLTPGANNGVGVRAPLEGDAAYVGMEIQVLDDEAPQYQDLKPWQFHGSVYGVVTAKRGALKPAGRWNHEEILCQGRHVVVTLNGTTIIDTNLDEAARDGTLDGREHPGLHNERGHIGLLGHGAPLEYRNIRLRDLSAK